MADKIFPEGIGYYDKREKAPDFILGRIGIKPSQLIKWLQENEQYMSDKGWIYLNILRSKNTGEPYCEVDTWKPGKPNTEQIASVEREKSESELLDDLIPF